MPRPLSSPRPFPGAVKDVVQKQVEVGIDVVNDGELGKRDGFSSSRAHASAASKCAR